MANAGDGLVEGRPGRLVVGLRDRPGPGALGDPAGPPALPGRPRPRQRAGSGRPVATSRRRAEGVGILLGRVGETPDEPKGSRLPLIARPQLRTTPRGRRGMTADPPAESRSRMSAD